MPQEMEHQGGKTVFEEAKTAFEEILALEAETIAISEELTIRTDYETDSYMDRISRMNEAQERFEQGGGYQMEGEIEKVLGGLGFARTDFTRQTEEFSGGWRMRIELAKILLRHPDLILLDEPNQSPRH